MPNINSRYSMMCMAFMMHKGIYIYILYISGGRCMEYLFIYYEL
jgi:hypothetical protein